MTFTYERMFPHVARVIDELYKATKKPVASSAIVQALPSDPKARAEMEKHGRPSKPGSTDQQSVKHCAGWQK